MLESFSHDGDTVTVTCRQVVDADKLPSVVQKIRSGDIVIPRRTVLRRTGDSITGELGASIKGAPAKIEGKQTSSGDPSSTRYTAAVSVGIPLVGGKIEKAIAEQLNRLLDAERSARRSIGRRATGNGSLQVMARRLSYSARYPSPPRSSTKRRWNASTGTT